jgi:hypothetical protein
MPLQGYVLVPFSFSLVTDSEQELGLPFISISAPSIVSGMSGESEKTLRDTFEEAKVHFSCVHDNLNLKLFPSLAFGTLSLIH